MDKKSLFIQLKMLNAELKRREDDNNLLHYNKKKIHLKQMEFHKNLSKNRWVFGGNRTGKTECGAVETVWLLRGNHPFKTNKSKTNGWSVSLSTQVQRDVAQSKILHYLNPNWIEDIVMLSGKKDNASAGIIDKIYVKNVFNDVSVLGFKNCEQGRDKFQGTSLDFVWFDEEPPYDIYQECKMRILDKSGLIFGTMTPLKGLTWVYDEIYLNKKNDPQVWYETMSWKDNPHLNQEEVLKLMSEMSEDELLTRCEGKFGFFGGQVYANFDEQKNVIEPFDVPKDWFDNISIDPGFRNPLSAHWYAQDYDGNIYVIAEHFKSNADIIEHSNAIKQISNNLGWHKNNRGFLTALIDSAALQRTLSSPKNVVDMFYENGIMVNPNVNKDLFSGIQKVKNYICSANGERKLFIFKNCVNLIREIKSYFWGDGEVPVKRDDHCLDELRYYIMSKTPKTFKENSSIQLKYKQKLISQLKRQRQRLWLMKTYFLNTDRKLKKHL